MKLESKFKIFSLILLLVLFVLGIGITTSLLLALYNSSGRLPETKVTILFVVNISIGLFGASVIFWGLKKVALSDGSLKVSYPLLGIKYIILLKGVKDYKYKESHTPFKTYRSFILISTEGKKIKFTEFEYQNFNELTSAIVKEVEIAK